MEDLNQYEDICNDTSMSKLNIIEHGGSVEEIYSSRVTHIICATQKNFNVEQVGQIFYIQFYSNNNEK